MKGSVTFDRWITGIFDLPITYNTRHEPFELEERDVWLTDKLIVNYIAQLFAEAMTTLDSYSDLQIQNGLVYIIGPRSNYMQRLFSRNFSSDQHEQVIDNMYSLFTDYFDHVCVNSLRHTFTKPSEHKPYNGINGVCYMWWDYISSKIPLESYDSLSLKIIDVLEKILHLSNIACQESALHGLNHWYYDFPSETQAIIDRYLARQTNMDPELKAYAKRARLGHEQ